MRPVLLWLRLPWAPAPVPIPAFVTLLIIGYAVGTIGAAVALWRGGWSAGEAVAFGLCTPAGCVLGALFFYQAVTRWVVKLSLEGRKTGASMIGGMIGGITAAALVAAAADEALITLYDRASPWAFVGTAIGRVGCLLGGCDFGRPARAPWPRIRYPNWRISEPRLQLRGAPCFIDHLYAGRIGDDATRSDPVHPVPPYWTLTLLAGAAALWLLPEVMTVADLPPLHRAHVALVGYTALTWVLEPLRGDRIRGVVGGVSVAQWSTLGASAVMVALYLAG